MYGHCADMLTDMLTGLPLDLDDRSNLEIFFAGDSRAAGIQDGIPHARWPNLRSRLSAKRFYHLYRA